MTIAVLIATYNRARLLGETLDVLARSQAPASLQWEVVVADNNSSDDTRNVVLSRQAAYPVPLRYVFERRQGRSAALNAAMAATTAEGYLFTDDDVRVADGWLAAGAEALSDGWDYIGGPVRPIWEAPPPAWLDLTRADLWGTIAILDYGPSRFVFEERKRVPLGANMGTSRALIERIGGFRNELGRSSGKRVLGQEVPELLTRARAAGLRGMYLPDMAVDHHIPAARLTRQYYRRWWMGKGYSKSVFEAMQPVTEMGLDLRHVPHIGSVPRFMVGDAVRDGIALLGAALRGDVTEQMRREMRLVYLAGFISARGLWKRPAYSGVAAAPAATANPAPA
jgi:glycosyltransferase involved in cell wall biosynthesis